MTFHYGDKFIVLSLSVLEPHLIHNLIQTLTQQSILEIDFFLLTS